jgi:hypothetical protein
MDADQTMRSRKLGVVLRLGKARWWGSRGMSQPIQAF